MEIMLSFSYFKMYISQHAENVNALVFIIIYYYCCFCNPHHYYRTRKNSIAFSLIYFCIQPSIYN